MEKNEVGIRSVYATRVMQDLLIRQAVVSEQKELEDLQLRA
jgi:hypothetical protein